MPLYKKIKLDSEVKIKRGPFSKDETLHLINLVKNNWNILGIKGKKQSDNEQKENVWQAIFNTWNHDSEKYVEIKACQNANQLRVKWDNLKHLAQKHYTPERVIEDDDPMGEISNLVLNILEPPFYNPYDSDANYLPEAGKKTKFTMHSKYYEQFAYK